MTSTSSANGDTNNSLNNQDGDVLLKDNAAASNGKKRKKNKSNGKTTTKKKSSRLVKELRQMLLHPVSGISAAPISMSNISEWIATIDGPKSTPYEGGRFYLKIVFPEKYPFNAPTFTFLTKIYHCNVNYVNGAICLDVLKSAYSPALNVEKILLSISVLLQQPNPGMICF